MRFAAPPEPFDTPRRARSQRDLSEDLPRARENRVRGLLLERDLRRIYRSPAPGHWISMTAIADPGPHPGLRRSPAWLLRSRSPASSRLRPDDPEAGTSRHETSASHP